MTDNRTASYAASWSIESLYRDHHGWVTSWLRRKLGNSADAADLAQDVFMRVFLRKDDPLCTPLREPKSYLVSIANSLVVDHWRRRAVEKAYLEELAKQPEVFHRSPEQRLVIIQTLCELDAMLNWLPIKAKQAFLLTHVEGLSGKLVAQRLGVSDRMVRKYLAQAMYQCMQYELAQQSNPSTAT